MKNILKKLILLTLFIPLNSNALNTSWDFTFDTEYTLSDSVTTNVHRGVGKLKMQLNHIGNINTGNGGAVLNNPEGIVVDGDYAYVVSAVSDALEIIDISDPTDPTHHSKLSDGNGGAQLNDPRGIVKNGDYLYIAVNRDDLIEVVDVSDPSNPTHVTTVEDGGQKELNGARNLVIQGNYLYVSSYASDALEILDISNPSSPTHKGELKDSNQLDGASGLAVSGDYVYILSERNDKFSIINVSDKENPTFAGSISNGIVPLDGASGIQVVGNYAYVVSMNSDSLNIIDISDPNNPILASSLIDNGTDLLLNGARAIEIEGDYAYIAVHDEDAIQVIDITDPYGPFGVSNILDDGSLELNGATALKKVGDYLYIGSRSDDGVQILKIEYDNNSPNIIPNNPLVYSGTIDQITTTLGSKNEGNISYQISKDDGVTWWYLTGSTRQETTEGTLESNNITDINHEIQSFNGLSGGNGKFKWKAFLNSNGSERVELDQVDINSTSTGIDELINFEVTGEGYSVSEGEWIRSTDSSYSGSYSFKALNYGNSNSVSCFNVDREIYNNSTLSFFKSVESEAGFDFLKFYINGIEKDKWSGEVSWSQEEYSLSNGIYNFKWCYEKDGNINISPDTVWVDYIEITEDPATPPEDIIDIIDFETGTGYTISDPTWRRTVPAEYQYEGEYSIESDNEGINDSKSCFKTDRVLTKNSIISFHISVSSELDFDFLKFYVNGGLKGQRSGEVSWTEESYHIKAGTSEFEWCYEKDGSRDKHDDKAWVDYIKIITDPNPPIEISVLDFEKVGFYDVRTTETTPGPDWQRVTTEKYEGAYSIESQNDGIANSESCFERTQTVGPADTGISFYKKVSSKAAWPDWDHLTFSINGAEQTRWSGSVGWSRELYPLSPGTYVLEWCYIKNGTGDDDIDKAWIDLVSVTQDSPILTELNPVLTPTNDNTPSYTFYSSIAGDIQYGGSCSSTTDKAQAGNNTIIINSLADGIYTDCTIQVLGSTSDTIVLAMSSFTIDTTRITNTINYPIDTTIIENTSFDLDLSYNDEVGVNTGTIIINLYKYNTSSGSYGSDLAATYVDYPGAIIGGTGAIYPVNQLGAGQYKIDFSIEDTTGNESLSSSTFYINESPLLLTTNINNSGGGIFNYEFTIKNISSDNITNWIVGFQLDGGTITTDNGGAFSSSGNLFEITSNITATDVFEPGETYTISFSGTGDGIVTDLFLKSYTNLSPEVPSYYNLDQSGLEVEITTDSITGNEYCRNIALTNSGSEDITNWQIQFDLDGTVHTTSNGTFSKAGIIHTIDPLANADIAIGNTENIKFCTTGLTADNNWNISLVTLSQGDIIAPTISSTNPTQNEVKYTSTFDYTFNYSDNVGGDGIDINSDEIYLHKWDGSAYGTDIAGTHMFLGSKTVTSSTATYSSNITTDGQYKVIFKIFDLNNNFVTSTIIFYVGIPPSDNTEPIISSTTPLNDSLLPGSNHTLEFNYSDEGGGSGIDTSSDNITFEKWNGATWINNTNISNQSTTTTKSTYSVSNLSFGKYRAIFNISDNDGNTSNDKEIVFYIDEPELIIGTGSLDIGNLKEGITKFSSGEIIITVKTVGAGFDLLLNKSSTLTSGTVEITDWNETNGFGYDKSPYTSNINIIDGNEILATQSSFINTDGEKNTYVYSIKLGVNIEEGQAAGDYSGSVSFGIDLNY